MIKKSFGILVLITILFTGIWGSSAQAAQQRIFDGVFGIILLVISEVESWTENTSAEFHPTLNP